MAEAPAVIDEVVVDRGRFGALRDDGLLDRALALPFDARTLAALKICKAA